MFRSIKIKEHDLLMLFSKFIREMETGRQRQINWKQYNENTLENYRSLFKQLSRFSGEMKFQLRIRDIRRMNEADLKTEKRYWSKFDLNFRNFLYSDRGLHDNTVGIHMKLLRKFFKYLQITKGINAGNFYRKFYAPANESKIFALYPERLGYLIYSRNLDRQLKPITRRAKDVFILGCVTGLRFCDLTHLTIHDLEKVNGKVYLHYRTHKTGAFVDMLLPQFAVDIIEKYREWKRGRTLLPVFWLPTFNKQIKRIGELAGWTEPVEIQRYVRGEPEAMYKDKNKKIPYRFCDRLASHTMRRTAVTVMMQLGVDEQMVRRITGHRPNSKYFSRYVNYSQSFMDEEINRVFQKIDKPRNPETKLK